MGQATSAPPPGSSVAEQSALGPTGRWFEPGPGGTLKKLVLASTARQKALAAR